MRKLFLFFLLPTLILAELPDPESLVKRAPRIAMEEKDITSYEVSGTLDFDQFKLRFIVSGAESGQAAIRIEDPRDHTPMVVGADDAFAMYDPIAGEVLLGSGVPAFTLGIVKDEKAGPDAHNVVMGFLFGPSTANGVDGKPVSDTFVDIHSFLDTLERPLHVAAAEGGQVILSGTSRKGSRVKVWMSPGRKQGDCTRMEIFRPGSDQPVLVLDHIVLNQPVAPDRFAFPKKELLASELKVRTLSNDNLIKAGLSIAKLMRTMMARLAAAGLDTEGVKATVEKMSRRKVDWDALKKKDESAGKILRSVFGSAQTDP